MISTKNSPSPSSPTLTSASPFSLLTLLTILSQRIAWDPTFLQMPTILFQPLYQFPNRTPHCSNSLQFVLTPYHFVHVCLQTRSTMFKLLYRLNAHNLLAFATKFREPYHNTETCYILHAHSHAPQTLLLKLPVTALFLIIRGSNLYSYEPSSTQQFVSTHNITLSTDCNIHKQKDGLSDSNF